jgi:RNA polymerase sigma-70 factor (ECF subfamily)
VADSPSAETAAMDRQTLRTLLNTLDTLPERTRSIFRMHKFDGLSYAEVAAKFGISRSSVEKHMMQALRALSRVRGS